MKKLGLVTIGQAPRTDLLRDIAPLLAGHEYVEHGALDDLGHDQLGGIAPVADETVLVSRLRDGGDVHIAAERIGPLLDCAIGRCVDDRCAVVLVLCTGHLGHGPAPIPVHHAEDLAHAVVAAALDGAECLGVLCPLPEQVNEVRQRWQQRLGRPVLVGSVNPYSASPHEVQSAARVLVAAGAHRIFLDCIGYTEQQRAAVASLGIVAETAREVAVREITQPAPGRSL